MQKQCREVFFLLARYLNILTLNCNKSFQKIKKFIQYPSLVNYSGLKMLKGLACVRILSLLPYPTPLYACYAGYGDQ